MPLGDGKYDSCDVQFTSQSFLPEQMHFLFSTGSVVLVIWDFFASCILLVQT